MDPADARLHLLAQHAELRELLDIVTGLARAYVAGDRVEERLDRAIAELRDSFARHNRLEERVIAPLLDGSLGPARLARMLEEHAHEHRAMVAFLSRHAREMAAEIPDFAEELAAHMDAEERTFLSAQVLRDPPPAPA
jgi:hypothetical protein